VDGGNAGEPRPLGHLTFAGVALGVGVVAGLGAVVFRALIALFHNLLFLGRLSLSYDANVHAPQAPWGAAVVLVPVIGALWVALLVKKLAPEAKGHGVPEVMDAIYFNKGVIRPVVAAIKSLASALSIGSGGSVGREGPIIQIGASFGSTLGQLLPMPTWQRIALIGAGAGGGIAATFNTPIGGVLFAVELMMVEISARTLVPVAIATGAATYVGRVFFGVHPTFLIPALERLSLHLGNPWVLLSFLGLGLLAGLVCVVFIKSIYAFEDFFEHRMPGNYYLRHMAGMLLVGAIMLGLHLTRGHYYVEGVGYATIQDVLTGALTSAGFMSALLLLKLLATSLTLGSGASGGVFSPSLFLGATLGGTYGVLLNALFPRIAVSPAALAVAGMAGVVGGSTGAALAAIVMIFEMTLDYAVIVPMTITVAASYGLRRALLPQSIYTLKLTRRGHHVPQALEADVMHRRRAGDLMSTAILVTAAGTLVGDVVHVIVEKAVRPFVAVAAGGAVVGVISGTALLASAATGELQTAVSEVAGKDFVTVEERTPVFEVLDRMRTAKASVALVLPRSGAPVEKLSGVITRQQIGDALVSATELFSE
jgi:CIC family chloride channel protein